MWYQTAKKIMRSAMRRTALAYEPEWDLVHAIENGRYPACGAYVNGRLVREDIPNTSSLSGLSDEYEELPGLRKVPLLDFPGDPDITERTRGLAQQIEYSGEINPLIVVVDHSGPYIYEGAHRYSALKILGAKSFPALVIMDYDTIFSVATEKIQGGEQIPDWLYTWFPSLSKSEQNTPQALPVTPAPVGGAEGTQNYVV